MAIQQAVPINFSQGLDTKTDPFQVQLGKFLVLKNSVFNKAGLLQKRNGYGPLSPIDITPVKLSTLNGNLSAIGSQVEAFDQSNERWVPKGNFYPLSFSTLPVSRSAINNIQCDAVTSESGLTCIVYTELDAATHFYRYQIRNSVTGQSIVNPTLIPVSSGVVTGSPRVFLLGGYFIIVFTNVIAGVSHLQYIAISVANPTIVTANADIAASYIPANTVSWDGVVVGNKLFIAYNTTTGGQQIQVTYLSTSLFMAAPQSFIGSIATMMSLTADISMPSAPIVYVSFYDSVSQDGYVCAVDQNLFKIMTPTHIITAESVTNITSTAQNNIVTIAYEVFNTYVYDPTIATNFIKHLSVIKPNTVIPGTVGPTVFTARSVGIASKAFLIGGLDSGFTDVPIMCMLATYQTNGFSSSIQNTNFLIDIHGNVIARIAYENASGYIILGLPQAQVIENDVKIAYLFKDLITSVATSLGSQGAPDTAHVYSQLGINLGSFVFDSSTQSSSEIASSLNISGGMLWEYDGQGVVEQGFNLFPDNVQLGPIGAGAMTAQQYFYQVTYEWTDASGNIIRSAPSIPVTITTGAAASVTIEIPTLRLTYKPDVKIVIYRWSASNQIYYQVTSITAPILNDVTVDYVTYVDTQADSAIIGNSILYTTGGVIENIPGPASTATTLFDDRFWLIDAEDPNLLWFSKQVIESTPVEMSDLFTIYVAPTTGSQGSTGPSKCIFPMDDKLIIFKDNAIYYINGSGPDNTGANNQYSQPVFITSTVGCSNQNSIVFMPMGLMFQSNKGIWLLGRDLSTQYIGAPVEDFNEFKVNSAVTVPETNQVRFTLSNGVTLMYDYFFGQWGEFVGVPAIHSTIYEDLHTYVDSKGAIFQETPGKYLDNGNPVLLSFTTSWINLAGLQGYQRAFFFFLLGKYLTPHKLSLTIAYDYNSSPIQNTLISPTNFSPTYGSPSPYGQQSKYGGHGDIEQWRVFLTRQRCQSFQINLQEIYDPSLGMPAGKGLTLSGLNLVVSLKRGWRNQSAAHSTGGQL